MQLHIEKLIGVCPHRPQTIMKTTGSFPLLTMAYVAWVAFGIDRGTAALPHDPVAVEAAPAGKDPAAEPDGVSSGDWASIREAHSAWKHRFTTAGDGTFQATNPGQALTFTFDGRGFAARPLGQNADAWTWGLELLGYGSGESETLLDGAGEPEFSEGRLAFRRDARLEEWFLNDSRGLEQGWTLGERPAGSAEAPLRLRLGVRGGWEARVAGGGAAVEFAREADAAAQLTYGGLKAWDAEGRTLEARFVVPDGSRDVLVEIADAGAVYPVTIDPVVQQAYLKASNTEANDEFGQSLAVSGNTVVVGAIREDSNATGVNGNQTDNSAGDSGAAYVFVRSGTTWSQQAYLKASNTGMDDAFGISVAVSGDTVVVGASLEDSNDTGVNGNQSDNNAGDSGAAYVFVRSGTTWSQQAYLKASNTGAGDRFGFSVAVSGDTVLVGAIREDSNATGVNGDESNNSAQDFGAAYVFVRNGTAWSQQAYLKASNTRAGDAFGASLAISGNTVVVGAYGEDSNATGVNGDESDDSAGFAGAAYLFMRSGTTWSQQTYLKASNTANNDFFGYPVAISGDTVVVGAYREDSNATGVNGDQGNDSADGSGAAYVFFIDTPSPPALTIRGKKRVSTTRSRLKVRGTASDPDGDLAAVLVKVGKGKVRPAKGTASWSIAVPLKPGKNSVSAFARDAGGRQSPPRSIRITRR